MANLNSSPSTSRRRWLSDSAWLLGANLARNLGLLVIMVALARLGGTKMVGEYSLALAITAPIFIMFQLGLKGVYLTHKRSYFFSSYLVVQIISLCLAMLLSVGLAAAINPSIMSVVLLVGLVKLVDALSDLFSSPLQASGLTTRIFWGTVASSLIGASAAVVALLNGSSLQLSLFYLSLASTAAALPTLWYPSWKKAKAQDSSNSDIGDRGQAFIAIARAGLPAGFGGALLALVASFPQYVLAVSYGSDEVALYAVLFYIVMVADIFVATLSQGWILRARRLNNDVHLEPNQFSFYTFKVSSTWSLGLFPTAFFGVWLASIFVPVLFGNSFQITIPYAIPIIVSVIISPFLNFSNVAMIVRNLYFHSITVSGISALASVGFGLILIPQFGVAGAFWTYALASSLRALPSLLLIRRDEIREAKGVG